MRIGINRTSVPAWKIPLEQQIAGILRQSISRGIWQKHLPPERSLCETVGVSRPVLRRAIHLLQDEGLVCVKSGRPTVILNISPTSNTARRSLKIVLLHSRPLYESGPWFLMMLDAIRQRAYDRGYQLGFVYDERLHWKHSNLVLSDLVRQHEADSWILSSLAAPAQKWFHEQKLKCVISGTAFPGLDIPSVDDDLCAVARHAAGTLLRLGHRKIAYLVRDPRNAGEIEAEAGFRAAFTGYSQAAFQIVAHFGDLQKIHACLNRIIHSPDRPTAILVSHSVDALATLTYLISRGIRIPDDISIVSRGSDDFLRLTTPKVAYYRSDPMKHAQRLFRLIENPSVQRRTVKLVPAFIPEESLGASKR